MDLSAPPLSTSSMRIERRGEMFFNDALLCFQNWQSCASCHPDGRIDGLNWDLLNDGISNPKNTKSLLFSHETPPVMSLGVRSHAKVAVRAGFRYIQFTDVPEEHSLAVDAYLQSLEPVASPYAGNSRESKAGEKLYYNLSCDECHSGPYYTDLQSYHTGLDTTLKWDTPALNEVWRTEPYWHDGRYPTLEAIFEQEKHGLKESLTKKETGQLVSYLKTL
jgi:hypothetical protein